VPQVAVLRVVTRLRRTPTDEKRVSLVIAGFRRKWPKVNGAGEPASESGPDVAANIDLSPTRVVVALAVAARPSSTWSRLLNLNSRRLATAPILF
jgi:hypothetical protein